MNNVVDSSCWIEFAFDTSIGDEISHIINDVSNLVVPSITVYEVYKTMPDELPQTAICGSVKRRKRS